MLLSVGVQNLCVDVSQTMGQINFERFKKPRRISLICIDNDDEFFRRRV